MAYNNKMMAKELAGYSAQAIFDMTWGKAVGPQGMLGGKDKGITRSYQDLIKTPGALEKNRGITRKTMQELNSKSLLMSNVASAVPIMFDPEIVDLLNPATPFLSRTDHRGYIGHRVRVDNISAKEDPVGYVSETVSTDLSAYDKEFTLSTIEADMKICADVVDTSDFGQVGSNHFFNLGETNLVQRLIADKRLQERALLYGDPSQAGAAGDPYDTNAFEGIANICEDAGTSSDRSGVTGSVLKDIKEIIAGMLQSGYNIMPQDLEIWTSFTMHDRLQNLVNYPVIDLNSENVNFGFQNLKIGGVDVIAGDQIREHTFSASGPAPTTEGSPGDVFIVNKKATIMYELAPWSVIPLAREGLSERVGAFSFHTYVDRAAGLFNRYLYDYPLP